MSRTALVLACAALAACARPAVVTSDPPSAEGAWPPGAWVRQATGTTTEFRSFSAPDERVAWAGGRGGVVARTTDGGATWRADSIAGAASLFVVGLHAVDADTAVALGTHFDGGLAVAWRTTDGGRTWTETMRRAGEGVFFDGLAFWDARRGIAFGDPVGGRFMIALTDDGGRTWRDAPRDAIPPVREGEAAFAASGGALGVRAGGRAWIGTGGAGTARVFHTSDWGRTWSVADTPLPANRTSGIFGLAFADDRSGVAVCGDYAQPSADAPNVMRTEDGGRTWTIVGSSRPAGVRYGVALVGSDARLVASGPSGTGWSGDGGRTWTAIDTVAVNLVRATSGGTVWGAGVRGLIVRSR